MTDHEITEREAVLTARRDALKAIEAAGQAAEAERKAIDVEIAKADETQPDPYTLETTRMIEQHRLNVVDAEAFKRGRAMAQFPALLARQRNKNARAKRAAIDDSIAGEPDDERS